MSDTVRKSCRHIVCPQCGQSVRIPLFWVFGIEGIFRCPACRLPFKTGYKTGAVLSGTGFCLSMVTVQLAVYVLGAGSLALGAAAIVPLWIFYAYLLRKKYMTAKIRRKVARKKRREETPEQE